MSKVTPKPAGVLDEADFQRLFERVATEEDRESHFIRHYEQGVFDWIGEVVQMDGKSLRRIKSTPMRAFADYKCLLGEDAPKDATSLAHFPMPLAVIGRPEVKWRQEWGNMKMAVRNREAVEGSEGLLTTYSRPPRPMDLTFQIDFYAKMEAHMRWIVERMEDQFDPLAYFMIPSPYDDNSERYMPIKYGGMADNSDLEPGVESDRMLRQTLTITVEGFKWRDLKVAPTAQRSRVEIEFGEEEKGVRTLEEGECAPELTSEEVADLPSGPADTDGVS